MPQVGIVYDEMYTRHRPPAGHLERPERLLTLMHHLGQVGMLTRLTPIQPVRASKASVAAVHSDRHIEAVHDLCSRGGGMLDDGDTYVSAESYDVAMLAAGGVIEAVNAVTEGRVDHAFCAVRPPGHHAERDEPMGFCLFNNVAIGVRHAQREHGIARVAVLDWDVHHGNGTQHLFDEDPSILFISLHQYPFYPGTGSRNERGRGAGEGLTMNFPLPAGSGEELYLETFDREIIPALRHFSPDLLLISAGFDAHRDDLIGGMNLSEQSFAAMTDRIREIAPIVSVLEGGYHLDATARSVEAHLRSLLGE